MEHFLNYKKNKNILKDGMVLGIGGFLGGSLSGVIVPNVDGQYLKYLFLFIILLAIIRVYLTSAEHTKEVKKHDVVALVLTRFYYWYDCYEYWSRWFCDAYSYTSRIYVL